MNRIEELVKDKCPNGVKYEKLFNVCNILRGSRLTKKELNDDYKYTVYHGGLIPLGKYMNYNREGKQTMVINTGSVGEVVWSEDEFWASDGTYTIETPEYLKDKFIYYILKNQENFLKTQRREGGVPTLNIGSLENLEIPIPPIEIQEEIVNILDKFSQLEAELEAELELLIDKYQYYKDLIFDKKSDRNLTKLSEIGDLTRGIGLQKKHLGIEGYPCIHYGQIYTTYNKFIDNTINFVDVDYAKKLRKAKSGDILISGVSENVEDILTPIAWLGKTDLCISSDMFSFSHNQNTKYLTFALTTTDFNLYKQRFSQGTKVIRVRPDRILNYEITLPSLEKQKIYSELLEKFYILINDSKDGIPAEIQLRKKQYEYYRNKLLTFDELKTN